MNTLPRPILLEVCDYLDALDLGSLVASSKTFYELRYEKWFCERIDPYTTAIDQQDWIYGLGEAMQRVNQTQLNFFLDKFIKETDDLRIGDMCTAMKALHQSDNRKQMFELNIWSFAVISAKYNKHTTLMEHALQLSGGLWNAKFAPQDYNWSDHCKISKNNSMYFYHAIIWDCLKHAIEKCNTEWLSWLLKMDKRATVPLMEVGVSRVKKNIVDYLAKEHVMRVPRQDWASCPHTDGLLGTLLLAKLGYYWESSDEVCPCCCFPDPDYCDDFDKTDFRKFQATKRHTDFSKARQRKKHESYKTSSCDKKPETTNRGGQKASKWLAWRKEDQDILAETD